jgi:uncharacterized protein
MMHSGVLLSIHDVTPAWRDQVQELWTLCRDRGATPALLVVPDWHGAWPLHEHPEYVRWIAARVADGAEIFLHGERHDEVGLPRSWRDELRAFGRTAREGEFLTLDAPAAAPKIARGLELFRELGFTAIGFIPPAWLCRDGTLHAAAEAGLQIVERDTVIHLPIQRSSIASPVLRWSGRTPFRARASAWQAAVRWQWQRTAPVMRIALHPMDLEHPITRRSVVDELDRWLAWRPVRPYQTLLNPGDAR